MWESEFFPDLFPLAIPDHGGGRDVSPGVQRTLLDLMDEDVVRWEEVLDSEKEDRDDVGGDDDDDSSSESEE